MIHASKKCLFCVFADKPFCICCWTVHTRPTPGQHPTQKNKIITNLHKQKKNTTFAPKIEFTAYVVSSSIVSRYFSAVSGD